MSNGGLLKWSDTVFIYTNFIDQIYPIIVDNLTRTMLHLRYSVLRHSLFFMGMNSISGSLIIFSRSSSVSGDLEAVGLWESFLT